MKKIILCWITCFLYVSSAIAEKRTFGNGLFWELNDCVLTISGNGQMPDFSEFNDAPWYYKEYQKVVINEGITSIGNHSFTKAESVEIPSSVNTIGDYAFCYCKNLSAINIPSSVKHIGKWAFHGCKKLQNIILPNSITTIREASFDGCSDLGTVVLPKQLKIIEAIAFRNCKNLSGIEFPNSLRTIGYAAFFGTSLFSLVIPQYVSSIESFAFASCPNLKSIEIYSPEISIGDAFYNCKSISSVVLPYSLLQIGEKKWEWWGLPTDVVNNYKKTLRDENGKPILFADDIKKIGGYYSAVEIRNGSNSYYIVIKGGHYGLTDAEGKVIVPTEMEALESAGTGYLRYKLNGFWGVMNYAGKIIIDTDRGYTSIGDFVSFNKRFPYTMYGYKGECNQQGVQLSKIKTETPQQPANTATASASNNSGKSNTGSGTSTVIVEHHRDPIPVQEWVQCTGCGGSGTCSRCVGSGTIYIGDNLKRCHACGGRGRCQHCAGQGGRYYTVYK